MELSVEAKALQQKAIAVKNEVKKVVLGKDTIIDKMRKKEYEFLFTTTILERGITILAKIPKWVKPSIAPASSKSLGMLAKKDFIKST